jgi:hypothetical protein
MYMHSGCSSLHQPVSALNIEESLHLLYEEWWGGKGKAFFLFPDRPLYILIVALRAMFSLSMLEHVHEHSMYPMISMART